MSGSASSPDELGTRAELAAALTKLRESAGLSVRDLARSIGAPSGTLGDYLSGRHLPSAAQLPMLRRALERCGVTDPDEIERWFAAIRRIRAATDRRGMRSPRAPSPYRGLAAFEPEDAALFFGRSAETEAILSALRALARDGGASHGVAAVIGPSGAGKSSLLRAGVVAAIRAGGLGEHGTACVVTTPGSAPLRAFAAAVAELRAESADSTAPGRGVLVLDQFEELFTLAQEAQRDELLAALEQRDPRILVVLGMRADFYSAAAREPALLPALQHAQILVGPMSEQSLRSAIVEPARQVGAHLEESLVDVVLAELAPRGARTHDVGVLPLLSHAMLATWQRATGNRLTVADYRATGGIDGAVQRSAEEVYSRLSEDERELARRAFLRMVTIDDVAVTRRRVTPLELAQLDDGAGRVRAVVDRFVAGRLVTADEAAVGISHEALLSSWPRLREWVDADRDGLRLRRQLTDAVEAWQAAGRDDALVLRGSRLDRAREWGAAHSGELTRPEQDFVEASVERAEADAQDEHRRTRRRVQLVAVFAILALIATGFAAYGLRAQETAVRQAQAAARARDQALSRQMAIEAVRMRPTDPALANQLALAAFRTSPTLDARSALIDGIALPQATRIVGPQGPTASVAANPSGTLLATAAADDSLHLWSLSPVGPPSAVGVIRPVGGRQTLYSVQFSPDGRILAAAGAAGTVQLWDVGDPAHPRPVGPPLTGPTSTVYSLAFSPDGTQLAAASNDGIVRRWDIEVRGNPVPLAPLPDLHEPTHSVAYSPDSRRLIVGSDTATTVWNLDGPTPRRIADMASPDDSRVLAVAMSRDGATAAAGTQGGAVELYRIDGPHPGRPIAALAGATSWVNSLAFSPDGTSIAAASSDNTVPIWSTRTHELERTVTDSDPVTSVAYLDDSRIVAQLNDGVTLIQPTAAPGLTAATANIDELGYDADGSRLVVTPGADDDHVELWDTTGDTPRLLTRDLVPPGALKGTGIALPSPNGRLVAAGTQTGPVLLWNVADPRTPQLAATLGGSQDWVESVAFSPDSSLLAAGGDDRRIRLWDVSSPTRPSLLASLGDFDNYVMSVSFSPDGRVLAAGGIDGTVTLISLADPAHPRRLAVLRPSHSPTYSVAFSPDGRLLATGEADKLVHLYDVSNPAKPRQVGDPLTGPTSYIFDATFNATGRMLGAASEDGSVWVWRLSGSSREPDPQPFAALRAAGGATVYGLAFDPRRPTLDGGGASQVVRLWNLDVHADAQEICATAGTPITRAEWHEYVPGARYAPPCRAG